MDIFSGFGVFHHTKDTMTALEQVEGGHINLGGCDKLLVTGLIKMAYNEGHYDGTGEVSSELLELLRQNLERMESREVPSSPPTPDEVKLTHNFRRAMIGIDNARHLVSSTDFTQEDRNRLILTQLQNVEAHVREMCDSLEKTASGGESNH